MARRNPSPPAAVTTGPVRWNTVRVTDAGDFTPLADDVVIVVVAPDGAVRIVLPTAGTSDDRQFFIKRFSSDHAVTIVVTNGDPIDDQEEIDLDVNGAALHLGSDGVSWMVLS